MDPDRILGWKGSTATQWVAIQAYALATPPVTARVALWQRDTPRGKRFTECPDFLLKDIAKKHKYTLTELLAGQPFPAVGAPVEVPIVALVPVRIAVGNDRKLPQTVRIKGV